MAHWPRNATCTSAFRGQGAMPLAVRSSEGLGVTVQPFRLLLLSKDAVDLDELGAVCLELLIHLVQ